MSANLKRHTIMLALVGLLTLLGYWLFYKSPFFDTFFAWSKDNLLLFSVSLFALKVTGIIYPPLPGGTLTLAAIPILGWQTAYAIDLAGSIVGSIAAYHLGKKYGYRLLSKLFDQSLIEKMQSLKVKKNKEIEAIFVYRVLLGGTVLEAICYGAGILGIGFKNFLIGSILSHIAVGVPLYYLINNVFSGKNAAIIVVSLVVAVVLFSKLKNRYFE